jgi:hypothetical protein
MRWTVHRQTGTHSRKLNPSHPHLTEHKSGLHMLSNLERMFCSVGRKRYGSLPASGAPAAGVRTVAGARSSHTTDTLSGIAQQ